MKTLKTPGRILMCGAYVLLACAGGPAAFDAFAASEASAPLHAARDGSPWISLRDGKELSVAIGALGPVRERMQLHPVSFASADFDRDGVADLLVGYAGPAESFIALMRGNLDSIFPEVEAEQPAPFFPPSFAVGVPERPDFIATGDFDADGREDAVSAERGGRVLHFLKGDGRGAFAQPREISLPGSLSALAVGEAGRADGLPDLAVGVSGAQGASVVVFASPEGALRVAGQSLPLPEEPTALAFCDLDDDEIADLAVVAGGSLVLIHGGAIDRIPLGFRGVSIAAGRFTPPTRNGSDLAFLSEDGMLHVLTREAYQDEERWIEVRSIQALPSGHRVSPAPLLPLAVSTLSGEDLITIDAGSRRLVILPSHHDPVTLEAAGEPMAVLPLRLNEDALDDLVVLIDGFDLPVTALTTPLSTYTVNVTTDTNDVAPGNNICADALGKCSLRAAIQESNSHAGADTINFNIGSGTPTIAPSSSLPDIIDTVTINGATGGATRVQLSGASAGAAGGLTLDEGFSMTGNSSLIRSLIINRFGGSGITILTQNNRVEDCYIGTDVSGGGTVAGNGGDGVYILSPTFFGRLNTIGGTTVSQRNVISHNSGSGVRMDSDADANTVAGNYIGTDAAGSTALPNGVDGVIIVTDATNNTVGGAVSTPGAPPGNVISGNTGNGVHTDGCCSANFVQGNLIGTRASGAATLGNSLNGYLATSGAHDTIGGTSPSFRNVISGNTGDGVEMNGAGSGGSVRGNFIGTDITGTSGIPNGGHGILVTAGASGTIGGGAGLTPGACTGDCNVIAFNSSAGVRVDSATSTKVAIRGNSTFSNSGLGIDLGPGGITPNDTGDPDTGANNLQNFPVLTSAAFNGSSTTIKGALNSLANTAFTVDLFDNASLDPSGNGEGKTYLGSAGVTTNGSGDGTFTLVASGNVRFLTATVTTPDGNTSEFSAGTFNPGEASPAGTMTAARGTGTSVNISYIPACGASDHAVFRGLAGPAPISPVVQWTAASCALGVSGSASFDPGNPPLGMFFYFVLVGEKATSEGSYGRSSSGIERPDASGVGACDRTQMLTVVCP